MRAKMPGVEVDSAGTGDWHVGNPPYGPMQDAVRKHGIDMSGLRARQVRPEDFRTFDLILAMDRQNLADLQAMALPDGAKLHLFLEPVGGGDVPDPYYTRDFDAAFDIIETAVSAWAERLA